MGGISLGTGIFSGIDSASLIDQLIQIEARPRQLAQQRLVNLQGQQAAFLDINSALLGLKNAAGAFRTDNVFRAATAESANPDAIAATAGRNAATGSFSFRVARLVSTEQKISRGFVNADASAVGAQAFRFEVGGGRADSETRLSELNGGLGVDRGNIQITDSTGAGATVDLSASVTVNDVLNAINRQNAIGVTASVQDDRLVLTDTAGGAGTLTVDDVFGASTATDLGIAGNATAGVLTGSEIFRITESTPLSVLRDGLGIAFGSGGAAAPADFTIEVADAGGANPATFEIVLGELGQQVPNPDFDPDDPCLEHHVTPITDPAVATVGDLFQRISDQTNGEVTGALSADGARIELAAAAGRELTITEGDVRPTAAQFGLAGASGATVASDRLLGGINTRLASTLNGGAGVSAGTIQFTQRDGSSFTVDVAQDDTLQAVLDRITSAGTNLTASLSDSGAGVRIVDQTTGGSLVISDVSGTAAADLGILTSGETDGRIESGNLQAQSIGLTTRLDSLNAGDGVGTGTIRLTDSSGASSTLEITSANARTIDDLVRLINGRPIDVVAEINDTGDGLVLRDAAGGGAAIQVEDVNGQVARNLNIAGSADFASGDPAEQNIIDGSFERVVEFDPADTLEDVARKINTAGVGVDAAIIRDGAGPAPFRLILTSETSGAVGRFVLDTGGFDLGVDSISKGQDAVAFFGGGADESGSVLLTSASNSLSNVVPGLTIDMKRTTSEPVEVVVSRDVGAIEETMNAFVEAYNKVVERLEFHQRFDSETQERGVLLGDSTVARVRNNLNRSVNARPTGVDPEFDLLVQIGVRTGEGGRLEFDAQRFREAFEENPGAVEELLTTFRLDDAREDEIFPGVFVDRTEDRFLALGVMEQFKVMADGLTNSIDGLLTRRKDTLDTQIDLQEDRIDQFTVQLNNKRQRLQQQFLAMEQAIASLQGQQQSLASLGSLAG